MAPDHVLFNLATCHMRMQASHSIDLHHLSTISKYCEDSVKTGLLFLRTRSPNQSANRHGLSIYIEAGVMGTPGLRRAWVRGISVE